MKEIQQSNDTMRVRYKDGISAFGGIKQAVIKGKGENVSRISAMIFKALEAEGIPTWFVCTGENDEHVCRKVEAVPLQFIVRNRLAGSTARLLGVEEGMRISSPVYELRLIRKGVVDPAINDTHAIALGTVTAEELKSMHENVDRINRVLKSLFHEAGIELVDFKVEFGKLPDGKIVVIGNISPDNCRLWDEKTGRVLDKDRFRHDLSDVCAGYREVMERLIKISAK